VGLLKALQCAAAVLGMLNIFAFSACYKTALFDQAIRCEVWAQLLKWNVAWLRSWGAIPGGRRTRGLPLKTRQDNSAYSGWSLLILLFLRVFL
jgi:hypothetical protein